MKTQEWLKIMCMAGLMTAAWTGSSAATTLGTAADRTENGTENVVKVKGIVRDYETKEPIGGEPVRMKSALPIMFRLN